MTDVAAMLNAYPGERPQVFPDFDAARADIAGPSAATGAWVGSARLPRRRSGRRRARWSPAGSARCSATSSPPGTYPTTNSSSVPAAASW